MCFGHSDHNTGPIRRGQPQANVTAARARSSRRRPNRPAPPRRGEVPQHHTVRLISREVITVPELTVAPLPTGFQSRPGVLSHDAANTQSQGPGQSQGDSTRIRSVHTAPERHEPDRLQSWSEGGAAQDQQQEKEEGNTGGPDRSKDPHPSSLTASGESATPRREEGCGSDARWRMGDRKMLPSVKFRMQEEARRSGGAERKSSDQSVGREIDAEGVKAFRRRRRALTP